MSNIGSSKIAEMYVGSTKIAKAYVGSTLVFQLPAAGYDSYKIHLTWSSNDNFNMAGMCSRCYALTTVPLFNTSKVTNVDQMLWDCNNVESGALALYNQLSSQTTPPSNHSQTFYDCGSNTTTGAAELAQVPSDWK